MRLLKGLWRLLREHRTALAIVCLAVIAGLTGWRRLTSSPPDAAPLPPSVAAGADYTLERFVLTLLDETGRPGLTLSGVSMEHDPREERSSIQRPEATVTGPEGVRWEGSARTGWVDDAGRQVLLEGDVVLARQESETVAPMRLQTETLTLYPERDQARTPARVTLVQPGAQLQGSGLLVDLERGYYELRARVRGRYDVPEAD